MAKILDIGCGSKKVPGAVGMDIIATSDADVVHDLNSFPYPFPDSTFDEVYADNVLEHLDEVLPVMEEIHRISKPGAKIKIDVPYFRSKWAYMDPTHRHYFTYESLFYFDVDHSYFKRYQYSKASFKVVDVKFNETIHVARSALIKKIANRWPSGYETYLSHVFPLDCITYRLVVVK